MNRGFRSSVAAKAVLLVSAGALFAACAGETAPKAVTTTSLRNRSTPSDIKRYFAAEGKRVLELERVTTPLMTGKRPPRPLCEQVLLRDIPRIFPDIRQLAGVVNRLPDVALRDLIRQDLRNKVFLLQACVSLTGLVDTPDENRVFVSYRTLSRQVRAMLARRGIATS